MNFHHTKLPVSKDGVDAQALCFQSCGRGPHGIYHSPVIINTLGRSMLDEGLMHLIAAIPTPMYPVRRRSFSDIANVVA